MTTTAIPIRPSIQNLKPSATLLINERSKELIAEGKKVYRLGFGQSPFPVPKEVVAALQAYAGEKDYLPVKGLMPLREAVARFNKRTIGLDSSAEDIMIGPGSKELLLGLQMACDADLMLPSPSWVSYEPQAHIVQMEVQWIETNEKDKWLLTAGQLEAAYLKGNGRSKILLLNYPSNPVGATYSKGELQQLATVAERYGLLVVADEIYGELHFNGGHASMANFYPEGTIVSSGLSKWCGAGGWRLGTFTFPKEQRHLMDAMATIASESFSAVSAPVQYAAIAAFEGSEVISGYLSLSRKILKGIGSYVHEQLSGMDITMPLPEGGFYLFPNFEKHRLALHTKGIFISIDLCEKMLSECGVALLPGVAFGRPTDELTCRLSYVDFDGGKVLEAAGKAGNTPLNEEFIKMYCPNICEAMKALRGWL